MVPAPGGYLRLPPPLGGAGLDAPHAVRELEAHPEVALIDQNRRPLVRRSAILCAPFLGICIICLWAQRQQPLWQLGRSLAFLQREAEETSQEWGCGKTHEDVDYKVAIVAAIPDVPDEIACKRRCVENSKCMAWTYGKRPGIEGFSRVCLLKALKQEDLPPLMAPRPGVVSGTLPCHMEGEGTLVSLFCFTVAWDSVNDKKLLQLQHDHRVGCFACDSLSLYGNKTFEVGPGVWTIPVVGGLESHSGGEAGLSHNLEVALSVWKDVAKSRIYEDHDWTVKAAVDALFLPERLRAILPHHPEDLSGVYLNNCRFNLRGPIEVLSRTATEAWVRGAGLCFQSSAERCSGPCGWGEDVFLDQCLGEVLKSRRDNEWRLLSEDHCPGKSSPEQWTPDACKSDHVAFHPFRTPELFSQCLAVSRKHQW